MTTITNNFEGGTSGATISTSNAGGTGNTQFNSVALGGTGTGVFSTTAAHGTLGVLLTNEGGTSAYLQWDAALTGGVGMSGTVYLRTAVRFGSLPASEVAILRGLTSGGAQRWRICIDTSGHVFVRNRAQTLVPGSTSTMALAAGTWYRIEAAMAAPNGTSSTAEVRIYVGDSTTPAETIGPIGALDFAGPIDAVRFGHAAAATQSTPVLLDDLGASDTGWLGPAIAVPLVKLQWAGALTDTAVTVAYNLLNVASAQLRVSTTSDLATAPVTGSAVSVDANGNAKVSVSGLTADTVYYYGVVADGVLLSQGRGQFRTDPPAGSPASFSLAFGSCQQTNSNTFSFATIRDMVGAYGPARRLIHEGDLHYRDFGATDTAADINAQYKSSLAAGNLASMLTQLVMTYSWDNHDWGGVDSNASTPRAADLKAAYRSFVPHYHLADDDQVSPTGAIYQSWTIGRVRFIDIDTRSERSDRTLPESSSKNMLSMQQEAWLYQQLLAPEPVKIICSGIYWRSDAVNGDRWGSYYTQWARIQAWFAAHPQVNAYIIAGDRHALAADDGTSAGCYLPQAVGAAFDQGAAISSEAWSDGYWITGDHLNQKSFGWLDITDDGASITIDFSGYTAADSIKRVSMSTTFAVAGVTGQWGVPL